MSPQHQFLLIFHCLWAHVIGYSVHIVLCREKETLLDFINTFLLTDDYGGAGGITSHDCFPPKMRHSFSGHPTLPPEKMQHMAECVPEVFFRNQLAVCQRTLSFSFNIAA